MSADFGATQRSIANRGLTKVLLIGLGGSTLLHTVVIAGISYWAHHYPDEQMEIVEIDRVDVDPEPSPTPSTKLISTPVPKVVKPPVTASIPTPIPIKISTPQTISAPSPVVEITTSAVIKVSNPPLSKIVSPVAKRFAPPTKIVFINSPKSQPNSSFPDRLFSDPLPKNIPFKSVIEDRDSNPKTLPQQTKIPTQKIENNPSPSYPSQYPQTTTVKKQIALAPASKPAKLATNLIPDSTDNPPTAEKLISNLPISTSKSVQPMDRSIPIPIINKSSGDRPNRDRDILGEAPSNNTQIARNNGGDNSVKIGNQTNLGGSNQQNSPIGTGLKGNNNSNSSDSNQPNTGTSGNIATGSKSRVSIQCLRNCEIRYPDELENSDIGKDKILVRVTIDSNGTVTNAEIDRSSGNQNLDRVTLEGVKQMQLTATGQTRTYRIKISTLLR